MTIITPETISYAQNTSQNFVIPSNFTTRYKKEGYDIKFDKEPNELVAMEMVSYSSGNITFKDQRGFNFRVKMEEIFDLIKTESLKMPLTFKLTYQGSALNIVLKDKELEEISGKTTVKYNQFDIIQTASEKLVYLGKNNVTVSGSLLHEYLPVTLWNDPNFDMSTYRQYASLDYTTIHRMTPINYYYFNKLARVSSKKKALSVTQSTIILDDVIGFMRVVLCQLAHDNYYKTKIATYLTVPSIILQQQPNFLDDEIQKLRNEKIL